MFQRDAYVYVGVDLHKATHVGMMVDCYGDPMGKALKVANHPGAFPEWVETIHKRAGGKGVIFGLEDVHGFGRALATFLLGRGYMVKYANAYLTKPERDNVNKTDRNDALAVARITAKNFWTLPDADVDELQWALIQAVQYRRGLVEEQTRVKNRLHAFLTQAHPATRRTSANPSERRLWPSGSVTRRHPALPGSVSMTWRNSCGRLAISPSGTSRRSASFLPCKVQRSEATRRNGTNW